ncbi:MAG: hypothetical protein K6L75_10795 [Cellvibrionaceae bacterium]
MDIYADTKEKLRGKGFDLLEIEALASDIASRNSPVVVESLYQKFEAEAEKLPWPQDRDFGALVLEKYSANASAEISKLMLAKAIERARWCATCATSGGEGLARAVHIKQLEHKLANCT